MQQRWMPLTNLYIIEIVGPDNRDQNVAAKCMDRRGTKNLLRWVYNQYEVCTVQAQNEFMEEILDILNNKKSGPHEDNK